MGYSLLQWLLIATNVWLAVWAFGFAIRPGVALIVLAVLSLAITVPSTPGYIGPVQAAFVFALVPFGVSNELAFAASVFYLVAYWIPVTVVGALFFVSTGLRVGEVRSDVEEAASITGLE